MKNIDRRKFLFGAGGSMIALPWLEMNAEDAVRSLRILHFVLPLLFSYGIC